PEVLTRLSRAHATWAQALHFDADDLEARAGRDPALGGEAAAVRREERRHAETALARAEDAVRYGGGSAEAEVALADALRLTGDTTRGRSRFERALTLNSARSAETLRVQALLTAAEAGSLGGARDLAEEAVGEDPSMIRARLLYARALLVARDIAGARSQLEAVLRRTARHPRATALRDAIDQGIPPAPPTVEVGDGGIGAEDTTPSSTDPTPPPVETPSGNDNGGGNGGGSGGGGGRRDPVATPDRGGPVPAGRDYSWYVRMGDEQVDRGNAARAGEFYEAARTVRPSGSEALTGLGYVALEQGNPAGAVTKFRQAAQQGYAEAYIGLGAAYQRLGRSQDALTAYERYLERLPSGPRAATARQHVDELRRQLGSGGGSEGSGGSENEGSGSSGTGGSGTGGSGTGGSGTGGSGTGGSGTEGTGGSSAPPTDEGALPPPRDMQGPPPEDVPAVGSEP
ncbi:MAG: tetratricopeptide repeat protein, partial [Sandaracinaceae bacterium]